MKEEVISDRAPAAIGPYSQAVKSGNLLFLSGQIPIDPSNGTVVGGSVASQTEMVLNNLRGILEDAGGSLDDVLKTTVYMVDLNCFAEMNEVYKTFFGNVPPARATVQVSALPAGVSLEIDAIASIPG